MRSYHLNNTDRPGGGYTKWNKSAVETNTLWFYIYMEQVQWTDACQRVGDGGTGKMGEGEWEIVFQLRIEKVTGIKDRIRNIVNGIVIGFYDIFW